MKEQAKKEKKTQPNVGQHSQLNGMCFECRPL